MNISNYNTYISSETMMGPNSIRILAELVDKYPLQFVPDDIILDLGCGTGLTSLVIAKETKPTATGVLTTEPCRPHFPGTGIIGKGSFDHTQFLPGEHRIEKPPSGFPGFRVLCHD